MIVGGNYIGKGAEAMLLVVRDQIQMRFPEARFWVKPINGEEAEKLKRDGFNLVYQKRQGRLFKGLRLLRALSGMKQSKPERPILSGYETANPFSVSDFTIDISGFASSDQVGRRAALGRWLLYTWASYAGNEILFLPQSWGPFENAWVRRLTRWTLKKASLIYARETISKEHLINSGCAPASRVDHGYDIAFLFGTRDVEGGAGPLLETIGLADASLPFIAMTPNMRIYERVDGQGAENRYIRILVNIAERLLEETTGNIVLIPHEASYQRENDAELCKLLLETIDSKGRMGMLSSKVSARQAKSVIGAAEFLIASRYHSLVASLSMRTPVAVIGWSHKYDELMERVGLADFIVDPVRGGGGRQAVDIIMKGYHQRDAIAAAVRQRVPVLEENVRSVFEKVVATLNNRCGRSTE